MHECPRGYWTLVHVLLSARLIRVHGRGARERMVPIGDEAVTALRRYAEIGRPHMAPDADDDTLFGGSGRDNIAGGLGVDRLNGVIRDDTFQQSTGQDTLFGGNRPAGRTARRAHGHLHQ